MSDWFGDEEDIAPAIAKLRDVGSCCYPADILTILADTAPQFGDEGFECWDPGDLLEIARRLSL